MFITALKGRHFWKVSIILIAIWCSAGFIFAAHKLRPRIGFANFADLGTFEGVEHFVGGRQRIQPCGSENDSGRIDILKKAANKYGGLLEDKFTFVSPSD